MSFLSTVVFYPQCAIFSLSAPGSHTSAQRKQSIVRNGKIRTKSVGNPSGLSSSGSDFSAMPCSDGFFHKGSPVFTDNSLTPHTENTDGSIRSDSRKSGKTWLNAQGFSTPFADVFTKAQSKWPSSLHASNSKLVLPDKAPNVDSRDDFAGYTSNVNSHEVNGYNVNEHDITNNNMDDFYGYGDTNEVNVNGIADNAIDCDINYDVCNDLPNDVNCMDRNELKSQDGNEDEIILDDTYDSLDLDDLKSNFEFVASSNRSSASVTSKPEADRNNELRNSTSNAVIIETSNTTKSIKMQASNQQRPLPPKVIG